MAKQKVYTLVAKDEKEMTDWFSTFEKVYFYLLFYLFVVPGI